MMPWWIRLKCWVGWHDMEFWRYLPRSPFPEHAIWQEYRCWSCGLLRTFNHRPMPREL